MAEHTETIPTDSSNGNNIGTSAEPIFLNIGPDQPVAEIESMCMRCHKNGTSKFMLTRIPHFKELIISAFECPHCLYHNNQIQSASPLAPKGIRTSCLVSKPEDLNRQLVVSEWASVRVEEVALEVPSGQGKSAAYLTTIEGTLQHIKEDLQAGQKGRLEANMTKEYEAIKAIIKKLVSFVLGHEKCTIVIDDPLGASYIEDLCAPKPDPKISRIYYTRTPEQLEAMGYAPNAKEPTAAHPDKDQNAATTTLCEDAEKTDTTPESVYAFQTNCSACNHPTECRMHMIEIPHFKEVLLMATSCDACGARSNEVRGGGAISPTGKRITLKMTSPDDLSRDILKSESCEFSIPEIDLHLTTNALGGKFSTLEGILLNIQKEIVDKTPFIAGDSADPARKKAFDDLISQIGEICAGNKMVTLVLDDPLGASYLQNLWAPDEDPCLTIETYERTHEQNEQYGLNDMKVENYQNDDAGKEENDSSK